LTFLEFSDYPVFGRIAINFLKTRNLFDLLDSGVQLYKDDQENSK